MKKSTIAVAFTLAGFVGMAQAAPKDDSWYLGAKLGWSQYHDTHFYGQTLTDFGNGTKAQRDQLATGIYGGYQINPYLGFEMGYDWLGRMPYKGSVNNGAFKAQGVQIGARLSYPIAQNFDIYTRLGGLIWRADAKASYNNGATRLRDHDVGISPLFAGGVEWAITPAVAARLEYQWVNNIGDAQSTGARPDNGQLSLGISYRFGQSAAPAPTPMPVSPPAPAPQPQIQTKQFTLKSDVLFSFNQSTLKPEGQQALDHLYSDLSNIDPNDGSVTVLGYTDRIGSDAYNQQLSEKRAESVQQYLIQKGIPAEKISARGMGKANPVTGQQCAEVKNRNQLIVCLAPDRRVEVNVQGIKDEVVTP